MFRTLGKTAIFQEREFEFIDLNDGTFAIISIEPKDLERGFEAVSKTTNRLIKYVTLEELDLVFEKDSYVVYKGDKFLASVIKENKVMLYTSSTDLAEKYKMNMRDRFEYYLYVDLKDIDYITQKWTPIPRYNKK